MQTNKPFLLGKKFFLWSPKKIAQSQKSLQWTWLQYSFLSVRRQSGKGRVESSSGSPIRKSFTFFFPPLLSFVLVFCCFFAFSSLPHRFDFFHFSQTWNKQKMVVLNESTNVEKSNDGNFMWKWKVIGFYCFCVWDYVFCRTSLPLASTINPFCPHLSSWAANEPR